MARSGKKEFIDTYVEVTNNNLAEGQAKLKKNEVPQIIENLQLTLQKLVAEDGDVLDLRGIARFEKYLAKERNFHNPQTGEIETAPAKSRIKAQAKF